MRSYGLPGIRQTRWIAARQQLTIDDVRSGTRSPTPSRAPPGRSSCTTGPKAMSWRSFADDHVHYVPFPSLVPERGREHVPPAAASTATVAALSSVPVMGPCIAMGAAAAHALDLAGSGSVRQIDIAALRRRVRYNIERVDCIRPPRSRPHSAAVPTGSAEAPALGLRDHRLEIQQAAGVAAEDVALGLAAQDRRDDRNSSDDALPATERQFKAALFVIRGSRLWTN